MPGQLFFLAIYCNKKLVTNVTFYVSTKIYINFSIHYYILYIKWQQTKKLEQPRLQKMDYMLTKKIKCTYILYFFNGSKVCYDFLQVSSLTYCKVLFFVLFFEALVPRKQIIAIRPESPDIFSVAYITNTCYIHTIYLLT